MNVISPPQVQQARERVNLPRSFLPGPALAQALLVPVGHADLDGSEQPGPLAMHHPWRAMQTERSAQASFYGRRSRRRQMRQTEPSTNSDLSSVAPSAAFACLHPAYQ